MCEQYNLATDPSRVAFGGGSFGGINALYVAMHYPHIFGGASTAAAAAAARGGRKCGKLSVGTKVWIQSHFCAHTEAVQHQYAWV